VPCAALPLLGSNFRITAPRNLRDSTCHLHLPPNDTRPRPTVFEPLQGGIYYKLQRGLPRLDWYQFLDVRCVLLHPGRNITDTDEMVTAGLILWKIRQDQRAEKGDSAFSSTLEKFPIAIDTSYCITSRSIVYESGMLYTIIATATALQLLWRIYFQQQCL
jgi:hypothetical protein